MVGGPPQYAAAGRVEPVGGVKRRIWRRADTARPDRSDRGGQISRLMKNRRELQLTAVPAVR